jgi:hypothetical protein
MKHLLNNLSEEEKNSIREQHEGGMKLNTSRFKTLLENKLGNAKPLLNEEDLESDVANTDFSDEGNFADTDEVPGIQEELDDEEEDFDDDDSEEAEYRMYDLPDVHQSIEDELEEMSDDEALVYLNGIIEFCEDKLYEMGQYGGSDEDEDDLGFASHSGDFDGDDSELDDEELDETW